MTFCRSTDSAELVDVGSSQETGDWMHAFSEILTSPPGVEILRIEDTKST